MNVPFLRKIGRIMKNPVIAFLLCVALVLGSSAARADFNDGVVAYLMGDYERAYATMRSLAEATDHAYAEYYLGMMYLNGQGVEQSYKEAGEWFLKAAKNRVPQAQNKLAGLYAEGRGMPRDMERAYAWYRVAAAHNHQLSIEALDGARARLSPEELAEAEKLAEQWITEYGPDEKSGEPFEIEAE
jgi:TPR repeat protein